MHGFLKVNSGVFVRTQLCDSKKKTASKNIDFWRSYGHLKLPFFDGQKKNALYEQI